MQAIRLSTRLMSTVLANQKYRSTHQGVSRSVHKIDLHIIVDYQLMLEHRVRSVWSQCFEVLKEYSRDLRNQFGSTADFVFGRLTITPTFAEPFSTFLKDEKDTLSLFESVCYRVHPEDHCRVDCLPDLLPMYGIVHLELCRCTVAYRDLERLALHTQGLKTLSLEDVKMEDDPPTRQASNAFENESSMPTITLTIPKFSGEHPPDLPAYWRVMEALPQIDELRLTTSRLLGMPVILNNLSRINAPIKSIYLGIAQFPGRNYHVELMLLTRLFSLMQTLIGFHMKIDFEGYIQEDTLALLERRSLHILASWALLPSCRLTSITFPEECLPSGVFDTWEARLAESARGDINTKSQLRRLDFYRHYLGDNPSFQLPKLLAFLKTHFPYVYYIGEGARYLADEREWEPRNGRVDTSALRKQILLQLEQNRVGLTLLDSRVDPPIPRGVWSHILANALAPPSTTPKDTNVDTTDQIQWTMKAPWSGIYCLVKELAERELLFVSPAAAAAAAADPMQEGRPWKQQRTI